MTARRISDERPRFTMSAGEERLALYVGSGPWAQAMAEWGEGPKTMKQTADWANAWVACLKRWDEKRRIALAEERALSAQLAKALRGLLRHRSPTQDFSDPPAAEAALAAYDAARGGKP